MLLPNIVANAIQKDHKLNSFATSTVAKVEAHISSNRMVFFPEYTDHSVNHIELVLQTAVDLATPASQDLLTPADYTVLAVAACMHDLGMHLTCDGFHTLVKSKNKWVGSPLLGDESWSVLWETFYAEATRFDGRTLRGIFGENYRAVRPAPQVGDVWDDFDYLLVGEFLRRNHSRLAYDIAVTGMPAIDGATIEICPRSDEGMAFLSEVSGLVARSHGMPLRPCVEYLSASFGNRINPRGTHPVFLAVLLRIADYFQIQSTRAPKARTDVVSIRSQLSLREWNVHQSVTDIHNTGSDPEAIEVIAAPGDVDTFLRLRDWICGIQSELDTSWAILGEVFGLQRHNSLSEFGIRIRRVKSNIDNIDAFAKTVKYVPEKLAFEAANADLLKLLIEPLYGADGAIGIRELIQNAIDAVREFDDLASKNAPLSAVDRYVQEADVVLSIAVDEDNLPTEISVTDRGVGMTVEVVRDYFLKAGASFRRSDAWRREHEDEHGHSRVLRTGRFGVGALAASYWGTKFKSPRDMQWRRETWD